MDENSIKLNCYLLLVNHALEEGVSRNYTKNEEGLCLFIQNDLKHHKVKNLIKNINAYDPGQGRRNCFAQSGYNLTTFWQLGM